MMADVNLLTQSVTQVRDELFDRGPVSSGTIVIMLLREHPEYGKRLGEKVSLDEKPLRRMEVDEWFDQVVEQYDLSDAKQINGRMVILGLSHLDNELRSQLEHEGFLEILEKEHEPPIQSLLSGSGTELWGLENEMTPSPDATLSEEIVSDRTYLHLDQPAIEDELGREPFAEALAGHLRYLRYRLVNAVSSNISQDSLPSSLKRDQSFLLHLYGPWGSGKTSLLNFLEDHLSRDLSESENSDIELRRWIVVKFNAWQNQHIDPPWWVLMDSVYQQAYASLNDIDKMSAKALRSQERAWRFKTAAMPQVVAILIVSVLILLVVLINGASEIFALGSAEEGGRLSTLINYMSSLDTLLASLVAIGGITLGLSRTLLPGTAKAAKTFMDITSNPLQRITDHYKDLVRWVEYPIAVFIDDLDRCDSDYVVRLLEGIQTLFRGAPVFYVIAADSRWLQSSYEEAYEVFTDDVNELGRPLRYLFMEKIFQLSAPVPGLSKPYREDYWENLLLSAQPSGVQHPEKEQLKMEAEAVLGNLLTEQEILSEVEQRRGTGMAEQIFRAEAVIRLVSPELQFAREHRLKKYQHLVGSTPRAMKRMVNSYAIVQVLNTLAGNEIAEDDLALWTILSMRWPYLAEYLSDHPEDVALIYQMPDTYPKRVPEDLNPLFQEEIVRVVIEGKDLLGFLDEDKIRLCTGLRS